MKRNLIRNIGNAFILLSLGSFVFLGYPLLRSYFFSPPYVQTKMPSESFTLSIPKIKAQAPVIEQVDPWNPQEYQRELKKGVAHARYTGLPGEGRTIFLFAHSSGPPWNQVYYNTIFLRIGELERGDSVILDRKKKRYLYAVVDKKEVWPNEVDYLLDIKKNQLILQTCTPIGTSLRRLLVFAEPIT